MDTNFEEIFQGWLEKEEYNKNKGFLKKTKYWKKYFCVLRRYDGDENVYFQWFEREEDWRKEFPRGSFGLFPKYAVFKRKTERGKPFFEVSNDDEVHFFMAANETTMDLWVIQLMMQTRLNSAMTRNSFRVKGGEGKCLQRIGAKNLNCLLHVGEWGLTLALERTHSVLSQWPLTTIRNYECSDNNEFVFEAGRKSPMGEGKYQFYTTNSEDNAIFDQLDRFTSLRSRKLRPTGRNRLNSGDEQEIAQAYGKLRWSVMLNSSTLNLGVIPAMSSEPQAIVQNDKQIYNHLQRNDRFQSASTVFADSYDRPGPMIDRTGSFNDRMSQMTDTSYSRLNCNRTSPDRREGRDALRSQQISSSYDRLERGSCFNGSPSSADGRSRSFGSIDGQNPSQFSSVSSPPLEDGYNHLASYRHASWSGSLKNTGNVGGDCYDKLDRSVTSVQHAGSVVMNSYDRLDNMQENVFARQDRARDVFVGRDHARDVFGNHMMSPPRLPMNDPPPPYDALGSQVNGHVPKPHHFDAIVSEKQETQAVEVAPPLPRKPSFMMQGLTLNDERVATSQQEGRNALDRSNDVPETRSNAIASEESRNGPAAFPGLSSGTMENSEDQDTHYQVVDEATGTTAEPRHRLDTHSSNPDLRKLPAESEEKLDPSKRTTLHRSAPSLAVYSVVNKRKAGKGSPKLSKSGSSFKIDGLLKRIGRSSKKAEDDPERSQEKMSRKSKKAQRKLDRDSYPENESTSSLRRLVDDEESGGYAEINYRGSAVTSSGRGRMERSESKRPLPDLPGSSGSMKV